MLDFSFAHKSQNSLWKECNLKKVFYKCWKILSHKLLWLSCFYKIILVKIHDALSSEFQGCLERAKKKREKKNYCLLYVPHWSAVNVSLFFSLAQDSCSVTRLFLIGWALKESAFAILCERVAIRLDNLNARIIPLRILFLSESNSLGNLL